MKKCIKFAGFSLLLLMSSSLSCSSPILFLLRWWHFWTKQLQLHHDRIGCNGRENKQCPNPRRCQRCSSKPDRATVETTSAHVWLDRCSLWTIRQLERCISLPGFASSLTCLFSWFPRFDRWDSKYVYAL